MQVLIIIATAAVASSYRIALSRGQLQMSRFSEDNNWLSKSIRVGATALLICGTIQSSTPAIAANYGGFGSTYSEVVLPKDAVIDSELVGSDDFKKGQEGLAKVISKVSAIKSDFKADSQLDVGSRLSSDLSLSEIRIALNKYSAAFTEDTQKGSDRLIRQVIQGLTELQREAQVKEGKSRSTAKASNVERRLTAITEALESLAQYYKN